MRRLMALSILPLPAAIAMADDIACVMADGTAIRFEIDRNQFVDALDPNDPPRRKVTTVTAADTRFLADPILFDNARVRGFWAQSTELGTRMMIVQPDGQATYTETPTGRALRGTCEDLQ